GRGLPARRTLDRRLYSVVGHAPAQHAFHSLADFGIGRVRIPVEQRLRGHDLAVLAVAALRHLLVDPRLLQGMQRAVLRQPFERRDLTAHLARGQAARAHRDAVDDDRAGAALGEAAAETRAFEP